MTGTNNLIYEQEDEVQARVRRNKLLAYLARNRIKTGTKMESIILVNDLLRIAAGLVHAMQPAPITLENMPEILRTLIAIMEGAGKPKQ